MKLLHRDKLPYPAGRQNRAVAWEIRFEHGQEPDDCEADALRTVLRELVAEGHPLFRAEDIPPPRRTTTCFLELVDRDQPDPQVLAVYAKAVACGHDDRYSHEGGRGEAIHGVAEQILDEGSGVHPDFLRRVASGRYGILAPRAARKALRDSLLATYYTRPRGPRRRDRDELLALAVGLLRRVIREVPATTSIMALKEDINTLLMRVERRTRR